MVCTPPNGWIAVVTTANDTIYSLAQRYNTSAENISEKNCLVSLNLTAGTLLYVPPVPATAKVIPCGPPAGWVRAHVVQAGDNLYRIALSYGITFQQLQAANCMGSSTLIYAGQRLWVPNVPTRTPVPGVTVVPNFPTNTPTVTASFTTIPPTATTAPPPTATVPTATFTPSLTAFPTNTP
jgi:LysM repeat protein